MKHRGAELWPMAIAIMGVAAAASAQDLGPIVYVTWGQICSVSVSAVANHSCLNRQEEFGSPSWKPDGSALVVEAGEHDGSHSLVLLDRRAREVGRLIGSASHLRPAWSPDGKYVFGIDYGIGLAVARWDADGKNRAVIPVTGVDGKTTAFQMISFSPSGRRAALLMMDFRAMVIAKVADSRWAVDRILPAGFSYVSQSTWIDEERLLFVGKRDTSRGELWELNVTDGSAGRLGIDGLWLRDQIAVSPDRDSAVVSATADGGPVQWNLWRYVLRTRQVTRLTSGHEDVDPTWRR